MNDKLAEVEARLDEINQQLVLPKVISNRNLYQKLAKEHKELTPVVDVLQRLRAVQREIDENRELINDPDPDMAELAREELDLLQTSYQETEDALHALLLPKDPLDAKNVFLEIRAGTGGDEAALFGSDLYRMYYRFAETKGWKLEVVNSNETQIGGFKEIIVGISGDSVFSYLKYESGVHRVQRVPTTESSGRIHTSTVTVAVLPEADEVDQKIDEKDLRFDVFRSSGPGGQSVNTTDSAVRITHLPTGLVVTCQDEKSQHKNKAKALKVLRSRLLEEEIAKQQSEIAETRRSQVGTGERSERIRTYNFPENRVTDHRISLTLHRLEAMLEGDLEIFIIPLREHARAKTLAAGF